MKIIVQCIDNIPDNTLVKYNDSDILTPFDGVGVPVGVANGCRVAELSEGVFVSVCEVVIRDVARCVISSSFSKIGGVAYADNGQVSSVGSHEVGYVFPKSFTETTDYQSGDRVWIQLK